VASNNVLRWLDGRGWLVLSGGTDDDSEIRALALTRAAADGAVAYITLGGDVSLGEKALADMEDLGAPAGYLVDVLAEDDQTVQSRLADAGIVVIESNPDVEQLRSALMGAAVQGMRAAFENGAVILAEGQSVMLFGAWVALESGELLSGFSWLENGFVAPRVTSIGDSQQARGVLGKQPSAIAIGIGSGSALALGPDGEVELWGKREVAIALGSGYRK